MRRPSLSPPEIHANSSIRGDYLKLNHPCVSVWLNLIMSVMLERMAESNAYKPAQANYCNVKLSISAANSVETQQTNRGENDE